MGFRKSRALASTPLPANWLGRRLALLPTFFLAEGLVELIVLNVGLNAGVINTKVFTIMVMMALVTTFMTWVNSLRIASCENSGNPILTATNPQDPTHLVRLPGQILHLRARG